MFYNRIPSEEIYQEAKDYSTPGINQISSEHLKAGIDTKLSKLLSHMFTVCIQHGFVPEAFTKGLLIPILKKPNIDPTLPKHYRPITISVTISKLFEHHILDTCLDHDFSTSQYGFIPERGSDKAAALAHDVAVYASSQFFRFHGFLL